VSSGAGLKWEPTASLATLKLRSQVITRVRDFFARHGVLEVETPILSSAGTTAPNLHSFTAHSLAPDDDHTPRFLHTSPEFAMKRLLAAGSGSIYQICRVFRGGEVGRLHNPEFTMLEWYRIDFDHHQLMDEVAMLVTEVLKGFRVLETFEKLTYRDAFMRYSGIDPHTASVAELAKTARENGIEVSGLRDDELDGWRDLLMTHLIEKNLGRHRMTFIYDYPASQASLARVHEGDPPVADRFEMYLEGIELANGFYELADAEEQRRRFEHEQLVRAEAGLAAIPFDNRLLASLQYGLPDCSGVALGLDRFIMLAVGATSIAEVIAFPFAGA
jgi:lysyl-tRNA synthetase class 2